MSEVEERNPCEKRTRSTSDESNDELEPTRKKPCKNGEKVRKNLSSAMNSSSASESTDLILNLEDTEESDSAAAKVDDSCAKSTIDLGGSEKSEQEGSSCNSDESKPKMQISASVKEAIVPELSKVKEERRVSGYENLNVKSKVKAEKCDSSSDSDISMKPNPKRKMEKSKENRRMHVSSSDSDIPLKLNPKKKKSKSEEKRGINDSSSDSDGPLKPKIKDTNTAKSTISGSGVDSESAAESAKTSKQAEKSGTPKECKLILEKCDSVSPKSKQNKRIAAKRIKSKLNRSNSSDSDSDQDTDMAESKSKIKIGEVEENAGMKDSSSDSDAPLKPKIKDTDTAKSTILGSGVDSESAAESAKTSKPAEKSGTPKECKLILEKCDSVSPKSKQKKRIVAKRMKSKLNRSNSSGSDSDQDTDKAESKSIINAVEVEENVGVKDSSSDSDAPLQPKKKETNTAKSTILGSGVDSKSATKSAKKSKQVEKNSAATECKLSPEKCDSVSPKSKQKKGIVAKCMKSKSNRSNSSDSDSDEAGSESKIKVDSSDCDSEGESWQKKNAKSKQTRNDTSTPDSGPDSDAKSDSQSNQKKNTSKISDSSSDSGPDSDLDSEPQPKTEHKSDQADSSSDSGRDSDSDSDSKSKKKTRKEDKGEIKSKSKTTKKNDDGDPHHNPTIIRLKKYLNIAGFHLKYVNLWDGCQTNKARAKKMMSLLENAGLKGRPSLEKCKKIKLRREKQKEMKELSENVVINPSGRALRNRNSDNSSATEPTPEVKKAFSRIKAVFGSDSE